MIEMSLLRQRTEKFIKQLLLLFELVSALMWAAHFWLQCVCGLHHFNEASTLSWFNCLKKITICHREPNKTCISSAAILHLWSASPAADLYLPCTPGTALRWSPDLSAGHKSVGRWDCTVATGNYRLHAGGSWRRAGCRGRSCPASFGSSSAGLQAGTCPWPGH